MIISTIGRYAVLLQILLQDTTDLGASAAQSIIRDGATATAVADSLDLDTLPTADPHRILQSCSSITRKGRCKNGCTWDSSSNTCNPSGPAPTPPPFSSPPHDLTIQIAISLADGKANGCSYLRGHGILFG